MIEVQTAPPVVDESSRYRDQSQLSIEDENCMHGDLAEYPTGWITAGPEGARTPFDGLIQMGQQVFLPGDHLIGLITKLYVDPGRHITHVAIRTGRFFGHHKMVPIAFVSEVTAQRVQLSINREQFMDLPEYQADALISQAVDRALWKDVVIRHSDYYGIEVKVRDGIALLHGYVISAMNQWRVETAVKNVPGILGVRSYLISDEKLTIEVAGALGQIEQDTGSKFFTKLESGVAVILGDVSSQAVRDKAERCAAEISGVRGVINEICIPGVVLKAEDQRFLQPTIGIEMFFDDALSVTIQKVIINPKNRRVVAMVTKGRFPDAPPQGQQEYDGDKRSPERLMVLPVQLIRHLTPSSGFLQLNSTETSQYENFEPSRYITPGKDWRPPYPYCADEVLFLVE